MSTKVLVYPRDYSLGTVHRPRVGVMHVMNPQVPGVALCDSMLPLVSTEPFSLDEAKRAGFKLCRRKPCMDAYRVRVRVTGKSDRRDGPIGSDRRADRRRRGDAVEKRLAEIDESKRRAKFAAELRTWTTSDLVKGLARNAFVDRHWENDLICAELDARIPPRSR